jgi:glycosyltransferase involved in cell wall biosynthesis
MGSIPIFNCIAIYWTMPHSRPEGPISITWSGSSAATSSTRSHSSLSAAASTMTAVAMVASISPNKDYDRFVKVAQKVTAIRKDVTFIGIGGYCDGDDKYRNLVEITRDKPRIIFSGVIDEVEALVNACDVGILFSNKAVHGEGISNSIMEYMALCKPVIANNAGGTGEILKDKVTGFLVDNEEEDELVQMVLDLIENEEKNRTFGKKGREIIENVFSLKKMGESFEKAYLQVLSVEGHPVEVFPWKLEEEDRNDRGLL